jgi:nucleotide-binding universal stress UspA family protein
LLAPGPVTITLFHAGPESGLPTLEVPEREGWTLRRVCREGSVVDGILDECEESGADLIVMATKGREGFLDALRGSTTEQVLRGAKCPLLAVPA